MGAKDAGGTTIGFLPGHREGRRQSIRRSRDPDRAARRAQHDRGDLRRRRDRRRRQARHAVRDRAGAQARHPGGRALHVETRPRSPVRDARAGGDFGGGGGRTRAPARRRARARASGGRRRRRREPRLERPGARPRWRSSSLLWASVVRRLGRGPPTRAPSTQPVRANSRLRDAQDLRRLAAWADRNGLERTADADWERALALDPASEEARRAPSVRPARGRLGARRVELGARPHCTRRGAGADAGARGEAGGRRHRGPPRRAVVTSRRGAATRASPIERRPSCAPRSPSIPTIPGLISRSARRSTRSRGGRRRNCGCGASSTPTPTP